jgi:1-acyl-sn-glycerol-3-phosphate acyltransferase
MSAAACVAEPRRVVPRKPLSLGGRCRLVVVVATVMTLIVVGSVLMAAVALLTLFQARRLYTEVLARWLGWLALRVCGVRLVVHRNGAWPRTQTVYVSNHPSTLDFFILIALGLPNTRFFLSGFLRKALPLGVMGYLTGTFWTVAQSFPERRVRIFQRAERVLRRSGESVYLSPEGMRTATGEIGPFNKGAFHLATVLGAPIVPLYLAISPEINPGTGWDVRPGVVRVYIKPAIPTRAWKVEELEQNRKRVRDYFVELHQELKANRK